MKTLSVTNLVPAIRQYGGNLAAVGRAFKVTRQAVHDFVSKHPNLTAVVRDCKESMKDDAEDALQKAIRKGEGWAVCFYLKTQARDRGYVERVEQRHTGRVALRLHGLSDADLDQRIAAAQNRKAAPARNGQALGAGDPGQRGDVAPG